MWWSEGQRGCCEAVGGKIMMLVMWVMHQAIFDIGHTFGVGRLGSRIWCRQGPHLTWIWWDKR